MIVVYNLHFGPRPFVGLLRCELMLMSIADLNYIHLPGMSQKWQEKFLVHSFLVTSSTPFPEPQSLSAARYICHVRRPWYTTVTLCVEVIYPLFQNDFNNIVKLLLPTYK